MRKKTIVILFILSAVLFLIGILALIGSGVLAGLTCDPTNCAPPDQMMLGGMLIGVVSMMVGSVLGLVTWIGALVKQGKQQQWGWFAGTLASGLVGGALFGGICLLIYLIVVPETPQYPMVAYMSVTPAYQQIPQYPSVQPYEYVPYQEQVRYNPATYQEQMMLYAPIDPQEQEQSRQPQE